MDFKSKGMDWVASIRQKLENVCMEMEDKLCQEAKYVESQVQTVGVNVNKFLEEVMQDLLPSSCRDPVQENVSDSSVMRNSDAINADHINMELSHKVSGETAPLGSDSCRSTDSSEDSDFLPVGGASLVRSLEENNTLKISKQTIEEDISVRNKQHAPPLSEGVAPVRNQASLSSIPWSSIHLDPDASSGPADASSGPAEVVSSSLSINKENDILIHRQSDVNPKKKPVEVEPSPPEASAVLAALKNMSASSFFSEFSDSDIEKQCDVPLIKLPPGHESSSQSGLVRNNAADAVESSFDVPSSLSPCDLNPLVISGDALEYGPTSSCSILPTESRVVRESSNVESCTENVELYDNVDLGDSCVVVDNKDLVLSLRLGPRRSFKKILKQALASRMTSTKQREYEQLAILYGDIDADINHRRRESNPKDFHLKKLSGDDLSESDWELV